MKKSTLLLLAFLSGCGVAVFVKEYGFKKERSQQTANLAASRDSVLALSYEIDGLKTLVFQKDAIILTEKQAKEAGILEIERLKKLRMKDVITQADLQGRIRILRDSLKLPPEVQFVTFKDTSGVTRDYVRVPFTLLDSTDKYISIRAGMNHNRTAFYDVSVPISGSMTIGYQKDGLFKVKPVGVFSTTNQHLTVNQMDIAIFEEDKKIFQRTWFKMLVGAISYEAVRRTFK
jgi:hypothetical protein